MTPCVKVVNEDLPAVVVLEAVLAVVKMASKYERAGKYQFCTPWRIGASRLE